MEGQELLFDTTRRFLTSNWDSNAVRELSSSSAGPEDPLLRGRLELGWTVLLVPEESGGGSVSGQPVSDVPMSPSSRRRWVAPWRPARCWRPKWWRSLWQTPARRNSPPPAWRPSPAARSSRAGRFPRGQPLGPLTRSTSRPPDPAGYLLRGRNSPVQDADVANQYLVSGRASEGLTQFLVPARGAGVSIKPSERSTCPGGSPRSPSTMSRSKARRWPVSWVRRPRPWSANWCWPWRCSARDGRRDRSGVRHSPELREGPAGRGCRRHLPGRWDRVTQRPPQSSCPRGGWQQLVT